MSKGKEIPRKVKLFGTGQIDFFKLVPNSPVKTPPPIDNNLVAAHQEERIDKMHRATNRGESLLGLIRSSADKETRDFYKSIGWTEKARTEAMNNHWSVAMFRLKEVGVFDMIRSDLTPDEQNEITRILREYDQEHKMTKRKWRQFAIDAAVI